MSVVEAYGTLQGAKRDENARFFFPEYDFGSLGQENEEESMDDFFAMMHKEKSAEYF